MNQSHTIEDLEGQSAWTALGSQERSEEELESIYKLSQERLLLEQKKRKGCALLIGLICSVLFFCSAISYEPSSTQESKIKQGRFELIKPAINITITPKKNKLKLSGSQLFAEYSKMDQLYQDELFKVPKWLWIFQEEGKKLSKIERQNLKIIKYYANQEDYTLNIISRETYKNFFEDETIEDIEYYLEKAEKRKPQFYFPTENSVYVRQLIILALLEEYGGVYIDTTMTLVEPLSWLSKVQQQVYTNSIDRDMSTQFFAFHKVQKSSWLSKPTRKGINIDQNVRIFPALQPFFMASYRRTEFIKELNKQYRNLFDKSFREIQAELTIFVTIENDFIYRLQSQLRGNFLEVAGHIVLKTKQEAYNKLSFQTKLFAIDYYGVRSINQNYFPNKIEFMFDDITLNSTFYYLSKVSVKELEAITGPLKYMVALAPLHHMNIFLKRAKNKEKYVEVHKGSFVEKYLFFNHQQAWVQKAPKYSTEKEGKKWETLPKKVWIFWGSGIASSTVTHQLCTRNIKNISESSGFKYYEVNRSNLHEYLDSETISLINLTMKNSPHQTYEQTFSDFVRLALLIKHGGIYLDASFMLLQKLDWIVNISDYPRQFVYNRYGDLPQVLMMFNAQYKNKIYRTTYDKEAATKANWHLSYENNFIVAEPENQLIKDWFQQFILYHQLEHSEITPRFEECGVAEQAWSSDQWSYLYQMDAVKCVIGNKQKELGKNDMTVGSPGSKYYQIWSINGYNGVQKFRSFSNFDNPGHADNYFATIFSLDYVQKVIGRPQKVSKFFGFESKKLSLFLFSKIKDLEPKSLVGQHLIKYKKENEIYSILQSFPVLVELSQS